MAQTDEALYAVWLHSGDQEALRCLLERHRESLTLFLYTYVHSMEDAEELMLDAYVEAAAGANFTGRSSFKTWLFSVGKKLALMRLRNRRGPVEDQQDELSDSASEPPELELLREERKQQLYHALSGLREEYRQILILLYFAELSHKEAARVMGKTKKQIYHLTERAKHSLKDRLERTGFDDAPYR